MPSSSIDSAGCETVTFRVVFTPSAAVRVIVAVPGAMAVTLPSVSTVAIDSSDVAKVSDLSVVSSGVNLTAKVLLSPTFSFKPPALMPMAAKSTAIDCAGCSTVTSTVTVLPLEVVMVTVAVPGPTAVISPSALTVTTSGFDDSKVTVLSVVLAGVNLTSRV